MTRTISISCPAFERLLRSNVEMSVVHLRLDAEINQGYQAHIIVKHLKRDLSIDMNFLGDSGALVLDYSAWLQEPVSVHIELDNPKSSQRTDGDQAIRYIHGLITSANFLYIQGDFYYHEIVIQAPLSFATLTRTYKIYQNQTPVDILVSILKDFNQVYELDLDYSGKELRVPIRDFIVVFNETLWDFFRRLCSEWGLSFVFLHKKEGVVLQLRLGGLGLPQPNEAYTEVSYYPPDYKTTEEYLHDFRLSINAVPGKYTIREYDYLRSQHPYESDTYFPHPQADMMPFTLSMPENYRERHQPPRQFEVYEFSSHVSQPYAGNYDHETQRQRCSQEMKARSDWELGCLQQNHFIAHAQGHIRGLETGYIVSLKNHPNVTAMREWLIRSSRFEMTDIGQSTQNETPELAQRYEVNCEMTLSPSNTLVSPPRIPSPRAHLQTAVVVGPKQDHMVHTDEYGRVKIQFHWDRYGTKDENSSCWVRVNQPWAGCSSGVSFTPRVGQEVLVDFINGSPNRPVVIGRVHNEMNPTPWRQTKNDALSGIRSRELPHGNFRVGRSNHLVFDDTEDHIHTQLKSDHADSSLSLGDIHRVDGYEGREEARGQGFELRTDDWGAVRAGKGLYVSTHKQMGAKGGMLDAKETMHLLNSGRRLTIEMSNAARQAGASPLRGAELIDQYYRQYISGLLTTPESKTALKNASYGVRKMDLLSASAIAKEHNDPLFNQSDTSDQSLGNHTLPSMQEPTILMSSPKSIAMITSEDLHSYAQRDHVLTSGDNLNITTGKSFLASVAEKLSLFVRKNIRLISSNGSIELQTQTEGMVLQSQKKLALQSVDDHIELTSPKTIVLNAGGTYIKLSSDGIEIGTDGKVLFHSSSVEFTDKNTMPYQLPILTGTKGSVQVALSDLPKMEGVGDVPYTITMPSGAQFKGVLDSTGVSQVHETDELGTFKVEYELPLGEPEPKHRTMRDVIKAWQTADVHTLGSPSGDKQ